MVITSLQNGDDCRMNKNEADSSIPKLAVMDMDFSALKLKGYIEALEWLKDVY